LSSPSRASHRITLDGPTSEHPIGRYNRLGPKLAEEAIAAGLCADMAAGMLQ